MQLLLKTRLVMDGKTLQLCFIVAGLFFFKGIFITMEELADRRKMEMPPPQKISNFLHSSKYTETYSCLTTHAHGLMMLLVEYVSERGFSIRYYIPSILKQNFTTFEYIDHRQKKIKENIV